MRRLRNAFVLITAMPIILLTARSRGWSLNKTFRFLNEDCCDSIASCYVTLFGVLFIITCTMIALLTKVQ